MYCSKCGTKLEESWKACPGCGVNLEHKDRNDDRNDDRTDGIHHEEQHDSDEIKGNINTRASCRLAIKILALIAIVCFFCPLYMVSCAGQEVFSVSGPKITFGFQYMQETIEGNLLFGVLLLLPFCSLLTAFKRKDEMQQDLKGEELRDTYYIGAICSGTAALLALELTGLFQSNAKDTVLKITPDIALYLFLISNAVSMLLGGYLAYLSESRKKDGKEVSAGIVMVKSAGKVLAGSVIGLVLIMMPFAKELEPSNMKEYDENPLVSANEIYTEEPIRWEKNADAVPDTVPNTVRDAVRDTVPNTVPNTVPKTVPDTVRDVVPDDSFIFPNSDSKYLFEDEIRSVGADKLRIGRNEIFARHGRIFEDPSLNDYFTAQSWYRGSIPADEFNSDAVFNDCEKKNLELIQKVENQVN